MISSISPVRNVNRNILNRETGFKGGATTVLNNDNKVQKLDIVVDGVKNCSPLGNKLDYFA